ncbi:uncharacterized protein EV422DRAFT_509262 [Fimicolochytrium jonesii]|uniref:uncharacterized protein n=1 Tax=Fimicolochytrium jonesii TaxID=1396493 RepID=UPI0022FDBDD4|nr:uncharacterized protein EV422DRAFT_509262 [Fimicolochytrium jonesii]KAI8817032.1 hypothetical protein EV422DRAFT_509262 [Fimicolochytrium jonesii]
MMVTPDPPQDKPANWPSSLLTFQIQLSQVPSLARTIHPLTGLEVPAADVNEDLATQQQLRVRGHLHIEFKEHYKADSIRLLLLGIETANMERAGFPSVKEQRVWDPQPWMRAKTFLTKEAVLWEHGKVLATSTLSTLTDAVSSPPASSHSHGDNILPAGTHDLPFEFTLDPKSLTSMRATHASIVYKLRAVIVPAKGFLGFRKSEIATQRGLRIKKLLVGVEEAPISYNEAVLQAERLPTYTKDSEEEEAPAFTPTAAAAPAPTTSNEQTVLVTDGPVQLTITTIKRIMMRNGTLVNPTPINLTVSVAPASATLDSITYVLKQKIADSVAAKQRDAPTTPPLQVLDDHLHDKYGDITCLSEQADITVRDENTGTAPKTHTFPLRLTSLEKYHDTLDTGVFLSCTHFITGKATLRVPSSSENITIPFTLPMSVHGSPNEFAAPKELPMQTTIDLGEFRGIMEMQMQMMKVREQQRNRVRAR